MEEPLQDAFAAIVSAYFSRWRAAPQWTMQEGPGDRWQDSTGAWQESLEVGTCHPATRTITIAITQPSLARTATIIHECCHTVTSCGHGQRWRARMHQAATRASTLGDTPLAAELRSQVEGYAEEEADRRARKATPTLSWSDMARNLVADMVQMHPTWTFDAVIDEVTRLLSYLRPVFLSRFPSLPRLYDRAHARLKAGLPARPLRPRGCEEYEDYEED